MAEQDQTGNMSVERMAQIQRDADVDPDTQMNRYSEPPGLPQRLTRRDKSIMQHMQLRTTSRHDVN